MRILVLSGLAALLPHLATAETWSLATDGSSVGFVSIKNGDTAESHIFTGLTGQIGENGTAEISIPFASVETFIDIRNERMRDILFKVGDFPAATVSAEIILDDYADLDIGSRQSADIPVTVAANGTEASYDAAIHVTRIADNAVAVTTARPLIADARDFGYEDGLEELREIADLDTISPAVPVTFDLIFEQ